MRPGEGNLIADLRCRLSSAATGGAYCAFEFTTSPGDGVPLHAHEREDELYYILEGTFEIQCGGKAFTAEAGAMAMLPRGVPHAFRNPGPSAARALTVFIPGGFDLFVRELSDLSPDSTGEERDAVRRRHGIRML